ncbi:MAG: penicillin acylase family protein [Parvularculaceae bacterium]
MHKFSSWIAGLVVLAAIVATVWLWTPPPAKFDTEEAIAAAGRYDARIVRDSFGVPHIYGVRDADVAYGLGYAHAEDDWATFEDVALFTRGVLAQRDGKDAAIMDFLVAALGAGAAIDEKYEKDLSQETRDLIDGYVAGLNLYCAEVDRRCSPGVAPITPKDIVAGFAARTPFFYGLEDNIKALFDGAPVEAAKIDTIKESYLHVDENAELGSNAMAVAPSRSADGATRLMVNSHQPFTGPVAWYEARVHSEEGWNMIGGVFPGSPLILHGASPEIGWAFTVNKPDLVDVYALETDRKRDPRKYKFDGEWRDFERSVAKFRVKLFGPFSLPITRPVYRSAHGPVFDTPNGWRAISFAGDGDIRAIEQWRRMNRARNFNEWRRAMALQGIPSFNVVFAQKDGRIAYFYNMAIPMRSPDWDWSSPAPGDRADLVWKGVMPFGSAPYVIDPVSGFVVNANNEPWRASAPEDSPLKEDYPDYLGVKARSTNRGIREHELYAADPSITAGEFIDYKMDVRYSERSRLRRLIANIVSNPDISADPALKPTLDVLAAWDGSADRNSRGAALAITLGRYALGPLLNGDGAQYPDAKEALAHAAADLEVGFGQVDPYWGNVNRLVRGDVDLPLDGGPDTLRAIYSAGAVSDGPTTAMAGDTYIMVVEWAQDGSQTIRTIHQFGAATLDETSLHYADQAPLFQEMKFKTPPMSLDAVLAEATADYHPGRAAQH